MVTVHVFAQFVRRTHLPFWNMCGHRDIVNSTFLYVTYQNHEAIVFTQVPPDKFFLFFLKNNSQRETENVIHLWIPL